MPAFTPRVQAIMTRFLLGLVITELPVLTAVLNSPTPDYRLLGVGLIGGLSAAIEKYAAPQLVTMTGGVSTLRELRQSGPQPAAAAPSVPPPPTVAS